MPRPLPLRYLGSYNKFMPRFKDPKKKYIYLYHNNWENLEVVHIKRKQKLLICEKGDNKNTHMNGNHLLLRGPLNNQGGVSINHSQEQEHVYTVKIGLILTFRTEFPHNFLSNVE